MENTFRGNVLAKKKVQTYNTKNKFLWAFIYIYESPFPDLQSLPEGEKHANLVNDAHF